MICRLLQYLFFTACITAGFWSCKVGPHYQPVALESPASFRFDLRQTDTIVNLRWWELFQDPVLDSLIRSALVQNQDVRIAAENIAQAGYALNIAENEYWPKFNISADGAYGNLLPNPFPKASYSAFGGVAMNWELDLWGRLRRQAEATGADYLATQYDLRALQLELIAQVASTYFRLLEFRTSLAISRQTLDLRDSTLTIIRQRFERGIIAEIDVNQAEIQYAIAASAVPLYERQIAQTEHALSILVGIPPGPVVESLALKDQYLPPDIPEGLPSQLLSRRPDLLQAEQVIIA